MGPLKSKGLLLVKEFLSWLNHCQKFLQITQGSWNINLRTSWEVAFISHFFRLNFISWTQLFIKLLLWPINRKCLSRVYVLVYPNTAVQINWVEEISNSRTNLWYKILHCSHSKGKQISYVFSTFYEEIVEVKKNGEMYFSYPVSRVSFVLPFSARRVIFPENEIQFVIKE